MLVEEYPFNEASQFADGNVTDLIKTVLQHVDKHGRKERSIENTERKLEAVSEILKVYINMGMLEDGRFTADVSNKKDKVYLYVTYQKTKVVTIESRYPRSWPVKSSGHGSNWKNKPSREEAKRRRQLRELRKQQAKAKRHRLRYGR